MKYFVNCNLLNVRERESLESNVVKVLEKNDIVDISKKGKEFYKTNDGYYIKKEFLTKYDTFINRFDNIQ